MKVLSFSILFSSVTAVLCQQDIVSECPSPNGYFADAQQCDKYYHCTDGVIEEKLCEDGMAFNDLNPRIEKCDFLFQINCTDRPELQPPKPTDNCPRANGYFPDSDPANCGVFYFCSQGIGSKVTCPQGLIFSLKTGNCVWPDEAGRVGCEAKKTHNFTCPEVGHAEAVAHPRYADPTDCQYFYVCINGKEPRRNGCTFGMVFNTNTTACDKPKDVPDCKEYYYSYFDDYFSTLGGGDVVNRAASSIIAAALDSGYDVPGLDNRFKIDTKKAPVRINGNKGRKPIKERTPLVDPSDTKTADAVEEVEAPTRDSSSSSEPIRRRRPQTNGNNDRRRPIRRKTTTTTSTTTEAPLYDDYYYYDDADTVPTDAVPT